MVHAGSLSHRRKENRNSAEKKMMMKKSEEVVSRGSSSRWGDGDDGDRCVFRASVRLRAACVRCGGAVRVSD